MKPCKERCLMKRLLVGIAFLAFVAFVSKTACAEQMSGYVSDEQCASKGSKSAKASDWINPKAFESCAQKCAKNGSGVVFVTEDNKVLKLNGDSLKKALPHLGHRVSVSGKVEGGTLNIDKIASIKMDAQEKPANDVEDKMHDHH